MHCQERGRAQVCEISWLSCGYKIKGEICGNKILATINLAVILVEIIIHKCENW